MRVDDDGEGGRRSLASLVQRYDPLRWRVIQLQNRRAADKMQSKRQWASAVQILDTRSTYNMIIRWRVRVDFRYPLVYWLSYILDWESPGPSHHNQYHQIATHYSIIQ